MPLIRKEGKDTIIFASKEDHAVPSNIVLPELEPSPGVLLPNGEINWNCPCLGGMATGPCGMEFREAFTCFNHSTEEPKGMDCYEVFMALKDCTLQYPTLYGNRSPMDDLKDDLDEEEEKEAFADNEDEKKAVLTNQDVTLNSETASIVNSSSTKKEVERAKTN